MNRRAVVFALLSAALFGASTPAAKVLPFLGAGALVLSWSGTPSIAGLLGPLAIICGCVA